MRATSEPCKWRLAQVSTPRAFSNQNGTNWNESESRSVVLHCAARRHMADVFVTILCITCLNAVKLFHRLQQWEGRKEGSGRSVDTLKYYVKQNRLYSLRYALLVRGCSIAGSRGICANYPSWPSFWLVARWLEVSVRPLKCVVNTLKYRICVIFCFLQFISYNWLHLFDFITV